MDFKETQAIEKWLSSRVLCRANQIVDFANQNGCEDIEDIDVYYYADYKTVAIDYYADLSGDEKEEIGDFGENFTDEFFEEFCYEYNIEPHFLEIFEHYIIHELFGRRLEEKGEKVFKLHGHTIWGRSRSGQHIILDRVVEEIYEESK